MHYFPYSGITDFSQYKHSFKFCLALPKFLHKQAIAGVSKFKCETTFCQKAGDWQVDIFG